MRLPALDRLSKKTWVVLDLGSLNQHLNVDETRVEVIERGVGLGRGAGIPEKEARDKHLERVSELVHGGFDVRHPEMMISDLAGRSYRMLNTET